MPLMIQFHDGLACPTIVCDWCQQPIPEAQDGGYFFPTASRADGVMVPMLFLHKGVCDDDYNATHGALESWCELRDLPPYLARNLTKERH